MNILSIDTSSKCSAIAINKDFENLGLMNIHQNQSHGETLVAMIDHLLSFSGMKPKEIDLVAIGEGPGSFTGLRIGMSVAKTLAQVFDKEILAVSTLRALAYSIKSDKLIVPLIDARGGRVYYGAYRWKSDSLETILPSSLLDLEDLLKTLKEPVIFTGDAIEMYRDDLLQFGELSTIPSNILLADSIAKLAYIDYNEGLRHSLYTIKPDYVRPSQAERELKKKC